MIRVGAKIDMLAARMTGRAACLFLLSMLATLPASAQQNRRLDVERLRPAPDRYGFIGIPGTNTPGDWGWNIAMFTGYSLEPFILRREIDGARLPIVEHRVGADFIAQIGLFDRVAAFIDVPMVLWQDADPTPIDTGPSISAVAMRDAYLAVRVRVLGETPPPDRIRRQGEGLALQAAVTIPWGLEENYAGEGNPQLEGAVIGDFRFLMLSIGGVIGYRHRFAEPSVLGVRFANELYFGLAIETPVFFVENVSAIVETRVDTGLDNDEAFHGPSTAIEGDLGVRWTEGDLMMTWIVGTAFSGGVGGPAFRGVYGLSWAPRTHDQDRDGIGDDAERPDCRNLAEDPDGFEDDDGCPDLDNDADQIGDADDRCPHEAADLDRDEDMDGCTDRAADADRDGIGDAEDSCPGEAEDRDGDEDEDGCPDLDRDGDGVPEPADRCASEPEDRDAFEDDDGCPDPDNDSDGVGDVDDRCPSEAEDRDSFEDQDGCPDPDDDRDGAADAEDRCADRAETINGVADEDGCPDTGGRALWRASGTPPVLRGSIRFSENGELASDAGASIDQLARHLRARWGTRSTIALSTPDEARITALRRALADRGIEEDSFTFTTDASLRGPAATISAGASE
jgi:OmpA-OmpF porin, OOP family